MLIALSGVSISFDNCDALLPHLMTVLGTWQFRCDAEPARLTETIAVNRDPHGYRISSRWLDPPLVERSEAGAIFSLTAELARAFVDEKPERLCLHCAAVEVDGRLIIFPNTQEAGKSTLAIKLASGGFRIFADDRSEEHTSELQSL